jgi:hypothetical protein
VFLRHCWRRLKRGELQLRRIRRCVGWKRWRKRRDARSELKKELLRSGIDTIGIKSSVMDGVISFMK